MAGDVVKGSEVGFGDDAFGGERYDPLSWRNVNLRVAFSVPEVVAPVRVPDKAALTALAGAAALLAELRGLAHSVREKTVAAAAVDSLLLGLAVAGGLAVRDGDALVSGDDADWLDDLAALDAWERCFALVLDSTLQTADETGPRVGAELELTGRGIGLLVELYLDKRAGLPVTFLSDSLKEMAVAEIPPDDGEQQWQEWVDAHGDPAELLLGQLAKLSAVTVDGEVARLEALGLYAVTAKARSSGVSVPDLPPTAELTARDMVQLSLLGDQENFAAEFASWSAERTPERAARDLLACAADGNPADRPIAVQIVSRLGAAAEPALRDGLDRPELRSYAKTALLTILANRDSGSSVPPELRLDTSDVAWLITDSFSPLTRLIQGSTTFPFDVTQLADPGMNVTQESLFDAMARLDHPDAEPVLTMIGKHCNNKATAKLARKAAFKAASRRNAHRS